MRKKKEYFTASREVEVGDCQWCKQEVKAEKLQTLALNPKVSPPVSLFDEAMRYLVMNSPDVDDAIQMETIHSVGSFEAHDTVQSFSETQFNRCKISGHAVLKTIREIEHSVERSTSVKTEEEMRVCEFCVSSIMGDDND